MKILSQTGNTSSTNRRPTNRRHAAVVVEMAFILPLFFLLFFALAEFSWMVMLKQALTDAARAGCRKAVLTSTINQSDAEAQVRASLQSTISDVADANKCRVTFNPASLTDVAPGTEITASVEVNYADVSWFVPQFLSNTVLRSEARMRRE